VLFKIVVISLFFSVKNVTVMPKIGAQPHVNVHVVCPFLLCQFNQTRYCQCITVKLPNIELHKCRRCQVVTDKWWL